MGHFSNGTEGKMYEGKWCNRCVHDISEEGCPIMMLHFFHQGEEAAQPLLDQIIPLNEKGYNRKCKMFLNRKKLRKKYRDELSSK